MWRVTTPWLHIGWRLLTERRARAVVRLTFTDNPPTTGDRRRLHVLVDALHVNDAFVLERVARFRQARRLVQRQRRRLRRLHRGGA